MTISSILADTGALPGDSATFTFSFSPIVIFAASEIRVYHVVTATGVETLVAEGTGATNYSLNAPTTYPGTGSITYPADEGTPIPSTEAMLVKRVQIKEQPVNLVARGGYVPKTVEQLFDRMVAHIIDLQEQITRCIRIPITDETKTAGMELTPGALRTASHYLKVNSAGTGFDTAALSSGSDGTASDDTPAAVNLSSGASGSGADFSRSDHAHLLPTTVPTLAGENVYTETQVWKKGSDITSGAAITIPAGNLFDVTGVTAITSIVTVGIGTVARLHFDGALIFTHHSTNLVCPGGESIVTHAGMEIEVHEYASADWRVTKVTPYTPSRYLEAVDPGQKVTFFDDFIGVISPAMDSTSTGGTTAAISAGQGGRVTIISNNTVTSNAADVSLFTLDTLDWLPTSGGLTLTARLKVSSIATVAFFVGFTDAVATGNIEMPLHKDSAADTISGDAANVCGVGFDTQGTTDEFWQGGTKAGTGDTAATHSGTAPVNDTYVNIRVEVSTAGALECFINDTSIGTTANAIVASTPVTPVIAVLNRTTSARTLTIDYWHVQASR